MTYRRAAVPVLTGGLVFVVLLWWAGQSIHALGLSGADTMIDGQTYATLRQWLLPWSYDGLGAGPGADYLRLLHTGLQVRYAAAFVFFVAGAVLLVHRMPPVRGRRVALLLVLWAWAQMAATLALTVSAPWLLLASVRPSFRPLSRLSALIAAGHELPLFAGLVAAGVTALIARLAIEDAEPPRPTAVTRRAARWAATAGTAVVAVSLLLLSYVAVAARIQAFDPTAIGVLSEPGEFLRQWLLLGFWAGPDGASPGTWLLGRAADLLTLAVVWFTLRRLPALLTRPTLPALALGGVCATVLGLMAGQLLRVLTTGSAPLQLVGTFATAYPSALTFGLLAGLATTLALHLTPTPAPANSQE
ncbi:hypothetical protein KUM39_09830 [Streptomyces sp. J2-1]|uniref:hypothetical protein n=1 Tax=Streptomyces corallincola TaxID=2851888 RepID=UPI001C3925CC|nr:hypothetical protein [Streptomyces corallincola]MBV2354659.1 hypothetical protein [Streptomyces corallincola]